jgi:hypothetical protein
MPASWRLARLFSLLRFRGRNTVEFPPVEDAKGLPFAPPDPSRLHDLKLDPYAEPLLQVILRPASELAYGCVPATASFLRRLDPHLQPLDPILPPIGKDELLPGQALDLAIPHVRASSPRLAAFYELRFAFLNRCSV